MHNMSQNNEITALRSSGFSMTQILTPLLFLSLFLSLLNGYTVSELSTLSHLKTHLLKQELKTVNPLLLAHNRHLLKLKGITFDALGKTKIGQFSSDVVIGMPTSDEKGINLFVIKKIENDGTSLSLENFSLLTPFNKTMKEKQEEEPTFPAYFVQGSDKINLPLNSFSPFLKSKMPSLTLDTLSFNLLLKNLPDVATYGELGRRFSATLSPFAFTLLGLSFGLGISRIRRFTSNIIPICLGALYLIAFFAGKASHQKPLVAIIFYSIPILIIVLASLFKIRRISHGL